MTDEQRDTAPNTQPRSKQIIFRGDLYLATPDGVKVVKVAKDGTVVELPITPRSPLCAVCEPVDKSHGF